MKTFRLICIALLLTGCQQAAEVQQRAAAFADEYFAVRCDGTRDQLFERYHPVFFEQTPRDLWGSYLDLVDQALGTPREFERLKATMEALPNGTFVTFEYDVRYDRGSAREVVTVVLPIKDQKPAVFGHRIDSDIVDRVARETGFERTPRAERSRTTAP